MDPTASLVSPGMEGWGQGHVLPDLTCSCLSLKGVTLCENCATCYYRFRALAKLRMTVYKKCRWWPVGVYLPPPLRALAPTRAWVAAVTGGAPPAHHTPTPSPAPTPDIKAIPTPTRVPIPLSASSPNESTSFKDTPISLEASPTTETPTSIPASPPSTTPLLPHTPTSMASSPPTPTITIPKTPDFDIASQRPTEAASPASPLPALDFLADSFCQPPTLPNLQLPPDPPDSPLKTPIFPPAASSVYSHLRDNANILEDKKLSHKLGICGSNTPGKVDAVNLTKQHSGKISSKKEQRKPSQRYADDKYIMAYQGKENAPSESSNPSKLCTTSRVKKPRKDLEIYKLY